MVFIMKKYILMTSLTFGFLAGTSDSNATFLSDMEIYQAESLAKTPTNPEYFDKSIDLKNQKITIYSILKMFPNNIKSSLISSQEMFALV